MQRDEDKNPPTGSDAAHAPDGSIVSSGESKTGVTPSKSLAEIEPSRLFHLKNYHDLLRARMNEPRVRLFSRLTGLELHALWHQSPDARKWSEKTIPCPIASRRSIAAVPHPDCCQCCLRERWRSGVPAVYQRRRFFGRCGITNFCASVQVEKSCPLTLVLQARVTRDSAPPAGADGVDPFWLQHAGECVSLAAFHHAVALVGLILHDLESSVTARLASHRLETALWNLRHKRAQAMHLRRAIRQRMPQLPASAPELLPQSRAQSVVKALIDYVQEHFTQPINLDQVAAAMNMNASYLSSVFSQATGVTFHHFLEEVRMTRAKELLSDPRNRILEVARATGYTSLDTFRHAFRIHEGLSPAAWRSGRSIR